MGLKVSSGSSWVMLCFGYCYNVLAITSKLSDSKLWVKETFRGII